jgi:diguanylate cyclase
MQESDKQLHNAQEIDTRKAFVDLQAEDEVLLRGVLPLIQKNVDQIVAKFYQKLLQDEQMQDFFADEAMLARVRKTQGEYLLDLFCGEYDLAYFESRLRIGRVHQRIGCRRQRNTSGDVAP